jgi:hypothetical protein
MTTKCSVDSAIRCLEDARAPLVANEGSSLNGKRFPASRAGALDGNSSFCSSSSAPTVRMMASSFGKIPTVRPHRPFFGREQGCLNARDGGAELPFKSQQFY